MVSENPEECIFCRSTGSLDESASRHLGLLDSEVPYRVFVCKSCKFRWLSPRPDEKVLKSLYTNDGYFFHKSTGFSYSEQTKSTNTCMHKTIQHFLKSSSGKNVLDIGSATGEFVEIAQNYGLDVLGIEYSEDCVKEAKKKNLPVTLGTLDTLDLEQNYYDFIYISHVLEHLSDPLCTLRRVNELLAPQGLLYVEIPHQFDNILDRIFTLLRRYQPYGPFSLHHMSFFSPTAIRKALDISGFDIISITTYQPCRRSGKRSSSRSLALSTLLWCANKFFRKGDVIAIWARSRKP